MRGARPFVMTNVRSARVLALLFASSRRRVRSLKPRFSRHQRLTYWTGHFACPSSFNSSVTTRMRERAWQQISQAQCPFALSDLILDEILADLN